MFVRNAWHVVVFYRREDGKPVALEDRCCHRQAPARARATAARA